MHQKNIIDGYAHPKQYQITLHPVELHLAAQLPLRGPICDKIR